MRWEEAQREARTWHIDQVEWAIRLSRANPDTFREGDWMNFSQELTDFVGRLALSKSLFAELGKRSQTELPSKALLGVMDKFYEKIKKKDPDLLKGVQVAIRNFLFSFTNKPNLHCCDWQKGNYVAFRADESFQPMSWTVYHKNPVEAAKIALGMHFVSAGVTSEQIRNCPQCNELFFVRRIPRTDRKFYCSTRCTRLAATHSKRDRDRNKAKRAGGKDSGRYKR